MNRLILAHEQEQKLSLRIIQIQFLAHKLDVIIHAEAGVFI